MYVLQHQMKGPYHMNVCYSQSPVSNNSQLFHLLIPFQINVCFTKSNEGTICYSQSPVSQTSPLIHKPIPFEIYVVFKHQMKSYVHINVCYFSNTRPLFHLPIPFFHVLHNYIEAYYHMMTMYATLRALFLRLAHFFIKPNPYLINACFTTSNKGKRACYDR